MLSTCKKDKDCPPMTEPCPCTGDACIDEMMAYTYFLPGTWWVYEEQNSGLRDSVYVYEAFEGENENGFRYFTVRMHSEYDGYNYYLEYSETVTNNINYPQCISHLVRRTKTKPGDFVGTGTYSFYPIIMNDYRYAGEADEFISVDSVFYDSNSLIQKVYFDVDVCRSEGFEYAGFHLSPTIGITKKSLYDREEYWTLDSSYIIQ